jgi:hypothetical protein
MKFLAVFVACLAVGKYSNMLVYTYVYVNIMLHNLKKLVLLYR